MPKRTDISSVLVIGSGPIVIGQACEFDYSGTQACRVLRQEGLRVILVNSNPATIMTDPEFADATYVEPITPEFVEQVIAQERPDALLATLGGQPSAVILQATAPDGYSGSIFLLIGVLADGRLAGVRVIGHKETPGLGDKIELAKSPWIRSFDGTSLSDPDEAGWAVKKDGGQFDQFAGATITPRAVVKAVHKALTGLGFGGVEDVRTGKLIELDVADDTSDSALDEMCRKLLANTVIENYRIERA